MGFFDGYVVTFYNDLQVNVTFHCLVVLENLRRSDKTMHAILNAIPIVKHEFFQEKQNKNLMKYQILADDKDHKNIWSHCQRKWIAYFSQSLFRINLSVDKEVNQIAVPMAAKIHNHMAETSFDFNVSDNADSSEF